MHPIQQDIHACVPRAQIGNRRARALSRKPMLKQTNTREKERQRCEMKGEQFSRNRKRLARAARDEKFSISRTIIVALAAFTADARFQSRRRPVECILFTIPRRDWGRKVHRGHRGVGRAWRDRKIVTVRVKFHIFPLYDG